MRVRARGGPQRRLQTARLGARRNVVRGGHIPRARARLRPGSQRRVTNADDNGDGRMVLAVPAPPQ
eukprot:7494045-Ditylum_brightwellii.AAC.1